MGLDKDRHRKLAQFLAARDYLSQSFLGGPRWLKFAWVINLQKGATGLFVLLLIWWFEKSTPAAWVYFGLHGSYGLCWLLKHAAFRDPGWEQRITFGGALMSVLFVLGPYWVAPYLLISDVLGNHYRPAGLPMLGAAIVLHTLGLAIMMSADMQKHAFLQQSPRLISTGMFAYIRHPNYLGEMMIYSSYAVVVAHPLPWLILGFIWAVVFLPNILRKEALMANLAGWSDYKRRTGYLLPRFF